MRDAEQAQRLVRGAADRFGRLDLVISNAGGSPPVAAATPRRGSTPRIIELNLIAPLQMAQAANAVMQDQPGGGSIIMIGSVSGTRPSPGTAAYGAAKAGLHNLASTLAVEWAPRVRVNTVIPGPVATGTAAAAAHFGDAAGAAAVGGTIPMGRMASPDDVAARLPVPGLAGRRLPDRFRRAGARRRRAPGVFGRDRPSGVISGRASPRL